MWCFVRAPPSFTSTIFRFSSSFCSSSYHLTSLVFESLEHLLPSTYSFMKLTIIVITPRKKTVTEIHTHTETERERCREVSPFVFFFLLLFNSAEPEKEERKKERKTLARMMKMAGRCECRGGGWSREQGKTLKRPVALEGSSSRSAAGLSQPCTNRKIGKLKIGR